MEATRIDAKQYLTANYHTHTTRCGHAAGEDEEYVKAAIAAGITELGFSDHIPWPMTIEDPRLSSLHMEWEDAKEYVDSIRRLQKKYKDQIEILVGFEAEYLPQFYDTQKEMCKELEIDYLILGQHFVIDRGGKPSYTGMKTDDESALCSYVDVVLEGLSTGSYACLCHPDLIHYRGDAAIYRREMLRLCTETSKMHIPLEINLLGAGDDRHYPTEEFFAIAGEEGNDIIIGIDAHDPAQIGDMTAYAKGMKLVETYGLHLVEKLPLI